MVSTAHNRGMIALTEPQTWTTIGAFTALMLGMMTVVSTRSVRVLRAQIGGLDRDVQAIVKRTFGLDRSDR